MRKVLVIAVVVIVVVIAAGLYFLLSNLNSLVAGVIEKNGSEVTQTSVSVAGVNIKIRDGRGTIKGLKVESPEGYEARYVFSLEDITLDIDIESLRDDPIVIDEIRIQAPVINAEFKKTGESNLEELRKRVQAYSAGSGGGGEDSGGQERNIRIREFIFEEGSINLDASALGLEKRSVVLPGLRLSDIGGEEGAAPDELTKVIVAAVAKKAASAVAGSEMDGLIKEKLGGSVTDKAKDLLKKIGN